MSGQKRHVLLLSTKDDDDLHFLLVFPVLVNNIFKHNRKSVSTIHSPAQVFSVCLDMASFSTCVQQRSCLV